MNRTGLGVVLTRKNSRAIILAAVMDDTIFAFSLFGLFGTYGCGACLHRRSWHGLLIGRPRWMFGSAMGSIMRSAG
jgi:hypothetical protein